MMRVSIVLGLLLMSVPSWAGKQELEDLKRQVDTQRSGVGDLERIDDKRAVVSEITLLRMWLDEADGLLARQEPDKVREVIDRCLAQTELIRQKTTASKVTAQAIEREGALKRSRDRVEKTKAAIQQAQINKKALEMNVK